MSMRPFLAHVDACKRCRERPRNPCDVGEALLKEGARRLTSLLVHDPKHAKA